MRPAAHPMATITRVQRQKARRTWSPRPRRPRSERADDGPFPTAAKQGRTDRHPQDYVRPDRGPHPPMSAPPTPRRRSRRGPRAPSAQAPPRFRQGGGARIRRVGRRRGSQDARLAGKWQPRQESNLDQTFRKRLFYPLTTGLTAKKQRPPRSKKSPDSWEERGRSLGLGARPLGGVGNTDSNQ